MSVDAWTYELDFDAEGDPPEVHLYCHGQHALEVDEEPELVQLEGEPEREWSWEPEDWSLSPFAQALLDALNAHQGPWPKR